MNSSERPTADTPEHGSSWRRRGLCAAAAGSVVVTACVSLAADVSGVPGEWEWPRTGPGAWAQAIDIVALLLAVTAASLQLTAIRWARHTRKGRWCVPLLAVSSFCWITAVQELNTAAISEVKPLWIPYDPGASGYFLEARRLKSVDEFLAGYEQTARDGDVLHQGTHPPGLILYHRAWLYACREFPALSQAALGTLPTSYTRAFRQLEQHQVRTSRLSDIELAALWCGSLAFSLAAALAVIPICGWVRAAGYPGRAIEIAGMWAMVPALAMFLPKSDAAFVLISSCLFAGWSRSPSAQHPVRTLLLSALLWIGLLCSLAFLTVLIWMAVFTVMQVLHRTEAATEPRSRYRPLLALLWLVGGVLLWSVAFSLGSGCNLFAVWTTNLHKHAQFYSVYPRSYLTWLAVNPIELALAVGLPLFLLAASGFIPGRRGVLTSAATRAAQPWTAAANLTTLLVWGTLWLSGKNLGEVARLWLFLTPLLAVPAARGAERWLGPSEQRLWWIMPAAQAICAALIVSAFSGFHLGAN